MQGTAHPAAHSAKCGWDPPDALDNTNLSPANTCVGRHSRLPAPHDGIHPAGETPIAWRQRTKDDAPRRTHGLGGIEEAVSCPLASREHGGQSGYFFRVDIVRPRGPIKAPRCLLPRSLVIQRLGHGSASDTAETSRMHAQVLGRLGSPDGQAGSAVLSEPGSEKTADCASERLKPPKDAC